MMQLKLTRKRSLPGAVFASQALLFCLVFALPGALSSQSMHQSLREGDRQYNRDNYKAAEKQYRIAADLDYANPKALYNLGNALYQQGKWEDAATKFDQAARFSTNPTEQANALYNLGNAHLKQRKFEDAVHAYENSLHLQPGDDAAKRNLQMAKKLLQKEQQNQQQNKQQQQDKSQSQGDKQDPNQPQPPANQQDKQPPRPEKEQNQQPSGQPQQPTPSEDQPQPGKMKKEEALRLLETAIGPEDQRNARKYRSAQQKKPNSSKKDW
jgi:tetratricopeptide (TPR) repeat protein